MFLSPKAADQAGPANSEQQRLRLLLDIATASRDSSSLRDLFAFVLGQLCEFDNTWLLGRAYVCEPLDDSMARDIWGPVDPTVGSRLKAVTPATGPLPPDDPLTPPFGSAPSVVMMDLTTKAGVPRADAALADGMSTAAVVAITVNAQPVAVLELFADRPVELDEAHWTTLALVEAHLGRAIERIHAGRAHSQAQRDRIAQKETLGEAHEQIREQYARLHTAVNNIGHGLALFDSAQKIVVSNEPFARMYGLSALDVRTGTSQTHINARRRAKGFDLHDVPPPEMFEALGLHTTATTRGHHLPDGRHILISYQPLWDGGWVTTHEDITERTRIEQRLEHLANHDVLTELPNRLVLRSQLDRESKYLGVGYGIAALCLDLDHFKAVNDTLGHMAGDQVLRIVAGRLRDCLRPTDLVARVGGDEFTILQVQIHDAAEPAALAERIHRAVSAPIDFEGEIIVLDTSIGVSLAPQDARDPVELLKNADLALYRAKAEGRNTYRFFDQGMEMASRARRELQFDLRRAVGSEEFELHYQPIVDIATGRVSTFEALLRWNHHRRGRVPPDEFIPVAEESGLMVALGAWVLERACRDAVNWPVDIKVAVNVSPSQVANETLHEAVSNALTQSGLAPERLELEMTEAVLLKDSEAAVRSLDVLRSLGIRIALDDFGTGYSSLSYLRRFPFDKIKIDRSFVKGLTQERDSHAIIRAISSLATALKMITTAEGIETEEQLSMVRDLGCTQAQGYLFSPARRLDAIASLDIPPFGSTGAGGP